MITQDMKEESAKEAGAAKQYEPYVGEFVTIKTKKEGLWIKGILIEITCDHKLHIKGDYMTRFHPALDIHSFSSRPDRFNKKHKRGVPNNR